MPFIVFFGRFNDSKAILLFQSAKKTKKESPLSLESNILPKEANSNVTLVSVHVALNESIHVTPALQV